jgi:hypothetical protein
MKVFPTQRMQKSLVLLTFSDALTYLRGSCAPRGSLGRQCFHIRRGRRERAFAHRTKRERRGQHMKPSYPGKQRGHAPAIGMAISAPSCLRRDDDSCRRFRALNRRAFGSDGEEKTGASAGLHSGLRSGADTGKALHACNACDATEYARRVRGKVSLTWGRKKTT